MTESGGDGRPLRVGLVLEPGGVEDPYARGAFVGLERAVEELGVRGRVLTPAPKEGYVPSLSMLVRQRYDLVIGVGSFAVAAVDAVAVRFPDARLAIVGAPHEALEHRPANVQGVDFSEGEAGYLAGYLAALMLELDPGENTISAIGGEPVPAVERFLGGYIAGAQAASPDVTVLTSYTDDFYDPAKGRSAAVSQIAKGSRVVFQAAGASGLGALDAAGAHGVWAIGVDVDQSAFGPHVLTSAVIRLDVAVFEAVRGLVDGTFATGGTSVLSLATGGVGLGAISPRVPAALISRVEAVRAEIAAGRVAIPMAPPARSTGGSEP
jgi:basic membrane protein A and related proteins